MTTTQRVEFGAVLRRARLAAGLTQEELAERANLSPRAIASLEQGTRRSPHKHTVQLLADALGLAEAERRSFEAATRVVREPVEPPPEQRRRCVPHHPLVGRRRELNIIERCLAGDGPPVVLLTGEPGIGKTRLLDEAAERAAGQGWSVLRGGCQRRNQDPYTPLVETLDQHIRRLSSAQRRTALQESSWLTRLLPDLLEAVPPAGALPAQQERRLIFRAVGRYLRHVAGLAGTLLILDDLQWAGPDALDLLLALVTSEGDDPLRVVAAYRDTEVRPDSPLAVTIADLARQDLALELPLGSLHEEEAAQLLRSLLPGPPAGLQPILARAGGVPFFLVSFAHAAGLPGGSNRAATELPWNVAQVIRQRVAAVPVAAQEVLAGAAVLGRAVPRRLLFEALARPESDILTALEAACAAGLLEEDHHGYCFVHDVIREVIEGDLSLGRRAILHRQCAEALERSNVAHTPSGRPLAGEIAEHFLAAGERSRALPYVLAAGDRAKDISAHAEAERQYALAAELAHDLGDASLEAQSLEKLAGVLTLAGRYDEALAALQRAVHLRRREGDMAGEGCLVAEIGHVHFMRCSVGEGLRQVRRVRSALEAKQSSGPPRLSVALARLYAAEASLLHASGKIQEQLTASERALELARAAGDEQSQTTAETLLAHALLQVRRLDEALALHQALIPKYESAGDLASLCRVLLGIGHVQAARGEFRPAQQHLVEALEIAERIDDQPQIATILEALGWLAVTTGEWERAHAYIDRLEALIRAWDMTHMGVILAVLRGSLALLKGEQLDADRSLDEALAFTASTEAEGWRRDIQHKLAMRDLAEGHPKQALARLESVLDGEHPSEDAARGYLVAYAEARLAVGRPERAEELAADVIRHARAEGDHLALLDMLRVYGMVLTIQERWDEARRAFEEAVSLASRMPYPYAQARALTGLGKMFLAGGQPDQACQQLAEALAIFRRLGAKRDIQQVEGMLATVPQARHSIR